MTLSFRSPVHTFLLRAALGWLLWFGVYSLWLGPQGRLDRYLSENLAHASTLALRGVGIASDVTRGRMVNVEARPAVWVGDPCNGLVLYALFTGFVLAFPGAGAKRWFIPLGCLAIYLLNIVRVGTLAILQHWGPAGSVDFNHHYTFNFVVYGAIGGLWMLWVKKQSTWAVRA